MVHKLSCTVVVLDNKSLITRYFCKVLVILVLVILVLVILVLVILVLDNKRLSAFE